MRSEGANYSMIHPKTIAEEQFMRAAAYAARFELTVRLRAGAIPQLEEQPIKTSLGDILKLVIEHYQRVRTESDVSLLNLALQCRNKILHCELSKVKEKLIDAGDGPRSGGVNKVRNVTPDTVIETLQALIKGQNIGQQPVEESGTKIHRDIYGWLIELYKSGYFESAIVKLRAAIAVIERLADHTTNV